MANYLVINSKFKPFSYAELLQPVQMATAAHQDIENQYNELTTKASIWENMADEQRDPIAYNMYKTYSNDLKMQADQLAKEGLTPISRQNMLKMRQRYASDIVPIEQAYKRRQELIDEQRKLLAQDNTLMFDLYANNLSLDDLVKNPQLSYQSYSGAKLASQVGTAAAALAKEMRKSPRAWRSILNNQYFETMMKKGYNPEEITLAIMKDPNAPKELKKIVDDAIGSSNIMNWRNKNDILDRAYSYASQGLWNAVGDTQYQIVKNEDYLNPLQRLQYNDRMNTPPNVSKLAINPKPIYNKKEHKIALDKMNKFAKYFYYSPTDGKVRMNQAGWDEYNRMYEEPQIGNSEYKPQRPKMQHTEFYEFINSLTGGKNPVAKYSKIISDRDKVNIGSLWTNYKQVNSDAVNDATRYTEFEYALDESDRDKMKDAILLALKGTNKGLEEVDFDGKTEQYVPTGNTLSIEDLTSDDNQVVATAISPYGNTVAVKSKNGKVITYRLPNGINPTNESNRDAKLAQMKVLQGNIYDINHTGMYTDDKGIRRKATPEELAIFNNEYENATQEAHLYHSQLTVDNSTEGQKFSPYGY